MRWPRQESHRSEQDYGRFGRAEPDEAFEDYPQCRRRDCYELGEVDGYCLTHMRSHP